MNDENDEMSLKPFFLTVKGRNYNQEVLSLYGQIETALDILESQKKTISQWKRQLRGFLHLISGSRMVADYLNLAFQK